MINRDELNYKIDAIIEYLKNNGGYDYKVYSRTCSHFSNIQDSNIVEYAEDIKNEISELLDPIDIDFEDLPF